MATYSKPDDETLELLDLVMKRFHERLKHAGVRVGILMAFADVDEKTGERKGPALKGYGEAQAAAKIANVSLKDRLVKGYDVEMLIDGDSWDTRPDEEQIALLDHELTHVELTGDLDDLGRPKVKLRKEDFIVWGFLGVVQRHGAMALEAQSVRHLIDQHGQLLLGIPGDSEAQSSDK